MGTQAAEAPNLYRPKNAVDAKGTGQGMGNEQAGAWETGLPHLTLAAAVTAALA